MFLYICGKDLKKSFLTNTKIKHFIHKKTMEKNLLIQNLKSKAGIDNLSERTYDEVATVLLPMFADDEKITDESWSLPVQMLKSMSGQLRHEVADGINKGKTQWESEQKTAQQKAVDDAMAAFKAQWEKDHPDVKPAEKPEEKVDVAQLVADEVAKLKGELTGDDSAIGKLAKQFTDYMAKTEQEKKDALVNKIREELKDYLLDVRLADREPVVNLAIKETEVNADSDFDKLKIEVEKKYEKLYKEFYGDSGNGPYAGGAGGGTNTNKEFDNFIKQKEKEAEIAAAETKELEAIMM